MEDEIAKKIGADLGFMPVEEEKKVVSYGYARRGAAPSRAGNDLFDYRKEKAARKGRVFDAEGRYVGHKSGALEEEDYGAPAKGRRYVPFDDYDEDMFAEAKPKAETKAEVKAEASRPSLAEARWSAFQDRARGALSRAEMVDGKWQVATEDLDGLASAMHWLVGDALESQGVLWRSQGALELKAFLKGWVRGVMLARDGQTMAVQEV